MCVRAGAEVSIVVKVQQLQRYPVDLYYLVDVSASMQENLDQVGRAALLLASICSLASLVTGLFPWWQLKTMGVALSLRMMEQSSDLWLGFGSFVDKPVSPYINVHPSKINNPCR